MSADTPESSTSNQILDTYNPNREYLSDNEDMFNVELNVELRQELAQLRQETAQETTQLREELTRAHIRVATLDERAICNNIRNEGQLLRSEERYGYQIQARDIQLQAQDTQLQSRDTQIQAQDTRIQAQDTRIQAQDTRIQAQDTQIQAQDTRIQQLKNIRNILSVGVIILVLLAIVLWGKNIRSLFSKPTASKIDSSTSITFRRNK